jgi:hypothetical protein
MYKYSFLFAFCLAFIPLSASANKLSLSVVSKELNETLFVKKASKYYESNTVLAQNWTGLIENFNKFIYKKENITYPNLSNLLDKISKKHEFKIVSLEDKDKYYFMHIKDKNETNYAFKLHTIEDPEYFNRVNIIYSIIPVKEEGFYNFLKYKFAKSFYGKIKFEVVEQ